MARKTRLSYVIITIFFLILSFAAALLAGCDAAPEDPDWKGSGGKSAYELAVERGFQGTLDEWLDSLAGKNGQSAYELAVQKGYQGSEEEFTAALLGKTDPSAKLMYISPDGSDDNDGLTAESPKKTVAGCVEAGATRISARRGVYREIVKLSEIGELEIFPTDHDMEYEDGQYRHPIVFDTSDRLDVADLTEYGSLKRVGYVNDSNIQFDKVFIRKSLSPVVTEYGSRYNATVWLFSEDETAVRTKLKPVLTIEECQAQLNTFTYIDGYLYLNANMTDVAKIIVPTNWGNGFTVDGATRLVLKEVEVRFSGTYNMDIRNCAYFQLDQCACKYTSYASGFHPVNANGILTACYATGNFDGYGISGYGHTTFVDCVAEYNFDDGMSHHDGTTGTVFGGRYEGNGKGGVAPAYGARVNIYGGLYKNNAVFGIGYLSTEEAQASGTVQNAILSGNAAGIRVDSGSNVVASGLLFFDNQTDRSLGSSAIFTEYGEDEKNTP